ncbi:MAG: hypothetical protein K9I29_05140 [Bacteroidales bacterium]|nr:hypothetical protein [Bacteroidales bacterium]MCF8327658.1 hypothetical protein [Bacteroidales bacterium]
MYRVVLFLLISFTYAFFPLNAGEKDDKLIVKSIHIDGNEKTKRNIIKRELPVKIGDTIYSGHYEALKQQINNNLMNSELFNFVEVTLDIKGKLIHIYIKVDERWYIWPELYVEIADRNFNSWWKKREWSRVNYKIGVSHVNFRGRREEIDIQAQTGYEEEYVLIYNNPYLNNDKTLGLRLSANYKAYHTLDYKSLDNQLLYSTLPDENIRNNLEINLSLTYRPAIHVSHQVTAGYYQYNMHDTLLDLNERYAPEKNVSYPYFSYIFKADYRDYKAYPLKGFYGDFAIRKFGLPNNDVDHTLIKGTFRKYFSLTNNWYFATGLVAQNRLGAKLPYFLAEERGMGYGRDFVRGMEYYVFNQTDWIYAKSNLKRTVLPQHVFQFDFLENKYFGQKFSKVPLEIFANVFYDAGYVAGSVQDERANALTNTWQHGFGLGLDFVTYYDKVLRTELSWNHKGEYSLFFHMIAPI